MKPNAVLTASSVRYASWYVPWSWGKSSTPSTPIQQAPSSDLSNHAQHVPAEYVQHSQPVVTTNTPELAPAGIDKAAVVDGKWTEDDVFQELLARDTDMPKADIDPTQLIDHAGHLKELGLEYGWGITSSFEWTIESIYLSSGMGWAGSIVGACFAVRCVMFGIQVMSSDNMAAMSALTPVIRDFETKIATAKARGDLQQAQLIKMQQAEVMKPQMKGIFSMGGFMIMQAWIGFCAFRFLRAMGNLPVPGLSQDGLFWFTDLTVRDPYFVLPVATTAIMYTLFKKGGETGVQVAGAQAAQRQFLFTFMAFFIGIATAFQPAGLQLYFLTTSVLGICTGWLLRQNGVRRFLHIREVPSPESNELYSKVVSGEMTLEQLKKQKFKASQAKFHYEPAKRTGPSNTRTTSQLAGINVKAGTALPAHLKPAPVVINKERPDRDVDFEAGPTGSLTEKMSWYRRNYRLSYLWRRSRDSMEKKIVDAGYGGGPQLTKDQARRKKAAEDYEVERRRRFEKRTR